MGEVKIPLPSKLVIGLIFKRKSIADKALGELKDRFGEIDFQSSVLNFNYTKYYNSEIGRHLERLFISFKDLLQEDSLPEIKIYTNSLENFFSCSNSRQINIDPGFLSPGKFILATTKDQQQRIYLGKGIFAEVALFFRGKTFRPWDWTYPDYRSKEYIDIFNIIRKIYWQQIKKMYPSYLEAYKNKSLHKAVDEFYKRMISCDICPRGCRLNRIKGELGFCKTGAKAKVYSYFRHFGEEPAISGENGSGTIFFSNCNLRCVYCQNYKFSQLGQGAEVGEEELSGFMLKLQGEGCHNINFVTPTHVIPQILKALVLAIESGLIIPLVYNSSGYDCVDSLRLLEGIFDIYLPDARYADSEVSLKYSQAPDYEQINRLALVEMHRQVGLAKLGVNGVIKSGLIIRHLVLPGGLAGTGEVMRFIANELSQDTYISLMSQYSPYYKAKDFSELSRRISQQEYRQAEDAMLSYGLSNGWVQDENGLDIFAGINIKANII